MKTRPPLSSPFLAHDEVGMCKCIRICAHLSGSKNLNRLSASRVTGEQGEGLRGKLHTLRVGDWLIGRLTPNGSTCCESRFGPKALRQADASAYLRRTSTAFTRRETHLPQRLGFRRDCAMHPL